MTLPRAGASVRYGATPLTPELVCFAPEPTRAIFGSPPWSQIALMMAFTGDYFVLLGLGASMIDKESMKLKMLSMPEEERKKQEYIMKNKEERAAKRKKE